MLLVVCRFAQAKLDAQHAVSLRPDWPKAHARLAAACLGLQEFTAAVQSYKQCLKLVPDSAEYKAALSAAQVTWQAILCHCNLGSC